jgi:hypothetical protein
MFMACVSLLALKRILRRLAADVLTSSPARFVALVLDVLRGRPVDL